jgi:nitrous oxidase accessory protein
MTLLQNILGPRVPAGELAARAGRYRAPAVLFLLARLALLVSIFLPYWQMTLEAPQYPQGLHVRAYVNHLAGDVREVDGLNHYIGMRPLNEAAQLERSLSVAVIIALTFLLEGAAHVHTRWAALLAAPAILFPAFFLADLYYWLNDFGRNLDPTAALSNAIKPFTPPVLGTGAIGQFRTIASAGPGLWLGVAAALMLVAGLWFHRRAYKPLVDARPGAVAAAAALAFSGAAGAAPFDLAGAVAAAPEGAAIVVPAGTYRGPIVIDRPMALHGAPGAVIDGGGEGTVITIGAPGVTVRGFTVRGTGISLDRENTGILVTAPRAVVEDNVLEDVLFGIYLRGAEDGVVRGNTISGKDLPIQRRGDAIRIWQSHRALIEGNTVRESRDVVMWFSEDVVLRRNHVSRGRYGLHFMYTDRNVMEENVLEGNSVGAFLMYSRGLSLRRNVFARNRGPSGYGVGLKDMDGVVARENLFAGNRVGLQLDNSPSSLRVHDLFERNVFACNDVGIAFQPAVKRNAFRDNCFIENLEQVAVLGGGRFEGNDFTVDGRGNFWSDYRGWDGDGDGIGEIPYRAESLFENLMDREPRLRLFQFSPAQQAVELAARAFPMMAPEPKIADSAPLTRLPAIDIHGLHGAGSWGLLAEAALLLAAGSAAWGAGRLGPGRSVCAAAARGTCR